ncbi:MAG: carbohydrate binding family 9 domain-containing protein [Proteobacteria bacterium]|nr:carbohydrate binding family 9 domain-containing protein [Pseudomonadota bacterium]
MKLLFLMLLNLSLASTVFADASRVPLLDAEIKVDGLLNEAIWDKALLISLNYEVSPGDSIAALVKTEAFLIDSGHSFIIGFRAEDPDPGKIRAFLRDRDSAYDDDMIGVILDTYNDQRRALEFFVNPLGVQMDLIRNSNNNEDDSWDAIWDSAGQITDFGYSVEMEIPYNELQMPKTTGLKTWGVMLFRAYPRDVRHQLQNVKLDRDDNCYLCQAEKLTGFENADRGIDLEITPTLTAIGSQRRNADEAEFEPSVNDFEAGLDINWGISSNLTMNATINPDFSQVESDSAQLDVNQTFALFFPERRSFFLENADYFQTNMRLVHTRNIADPDYGIRFVGKNDKNAYGFFYTNDTLTNLLIPGALGSSLATLDLESSNFVGRFRRDYGESSTAGLTLTNREGGSYSNRVISVDTNYRLNNTNTISFQYANSETQYPDELVDGFDQPEGKFTGSSYLLRYRFNNENWRFNVFHQDKGDGFRADSGFIGQVGTTKSVIGGGYVWYGEDENWWNRINVYSDWDITHDQQGKVLEKEFEGSLRIQGPLQSRIRLGGGIRDRYWEGQIFKEDFRNLNFNLRPMAGLQVGISLGAGNSVDFSNSKIADSKTASLFGSANIGKHLLVNLNHNYRNLSRDGGSVFTANQTDLRFSYQFNVRQRLRLALIQTNVNRDVNLYNEPDDVNAHSKNVSTQLIYSYKVNPRTLLFVGYSDAGTENDDIESFTVTNKTLFVKFSYAWKR